MAISLNFKHIIMKKIPLLLWGFSVFTINAQVPNYVPTNGLVAYYPFNGNAIDESINTNDGTVHGAVLTTDRFGNPNAAYSFNHNDITFNTNIITSYPFSISGWFKKEGIGSGYLNYGTLFTTSQVIHATNGNGIHSIINEDTFAIEKSPNTQFDLYKNNLDYTNWHHFIITCDTNISTGTIISTLYIDGIITDTKTSPIVSYTSSLPLTIGRGFDGALDYSFIGKIDDLGVWNRALTQGEISDLFNATLKINDFSKNKIILYPSPAKDILNFSLSETNTAYEYEISNMLGEKVSYGNVNSNSISISNLANGVYIVKIRTNEGVLTEKFIKE